MMLLSIYVGKSVGTFLNPWLVHQEKKNKQKIGADISKKFKRNQFSMGYSFTTALFLFSECG